MSSSDSLKAFLSGGFGGMCNIFVGYPLDTVKVKLMADSKGQFKGMVDCFKQTIGRDGIRGLYAGLGAPLVAVTPIFATYFWGYNVGKQIAANVEGVSTDKISLIGNVFAGAFSALPGTAVMLPGDRIKVMLQLERETGGKPRFTNPINTGAYILKHEGPTGFYRGTAITLLRDIPGSLTYYTSYEMLKKKLNELYRVTLPPPPEEDLLQQQQQQHVSPFVIVFAGGISGINTWLVAVPADVVKSRFQANPNAYPGGFRQVARIMLKKEGAKAFYKGLAPALTRAFPANAAFFLGMEVSRKFLDQYL